MFLGKKYNYLHGIYLKFLPWRWLVHFTSIKESLLNLYFPLERVTRDISKRMHILEVFKFRCASGSFGQASEKIWHHIQNEWIRISEATWACPQALICCSLKKCLRWLQFVVIMSNNFIILRESCLPIQL